MEKDATLPNDFPTDGVELRCFLVVSDYTRSLAFYRDVLGARVLCELAGALCFLSFAGNQILLSAPFGSRSAYHERDRRWSPSSRVRAKLCPCPGSNCFSGTGWACPALVITAFPRKNLVLTKKWRYILCP